MILYTITRFLSLQGSPWDHHTCLTGSVATWIEAKDGHIFIEQFVKRITWRNWRRGLRGKVAVSPSPSPDKAQEAKWEKGIWKIRPVIKTAIIEQCTSNTTVDSFADCYSINKSEKQLLIPCGWWIFVSDQSCHQQSYFPRLVECESTEARLPRRLMYWRSVLSFGQTITGALKCWRLTWKDCRNCLWHSITC